MSGVKIDYEDILDELATWAAKESNGEKKWGHEKIETLSKANMDRGLQKRIQERLGNVGDFDVLPKSLPNQPQIKQWEPLRIQKRTPYSPLQSSIPL